MKASQRIASIIAAGSTLCAGAILVASPAPASHNPLEGSTGNWDSPKGHDAARHMFTPQEQDGLIFLLQSISTSASMSANPSCPCGFQSHRNLSFNGHITNPMADYAYRVASVRIDALEDAQGRSLLGRGNINVNPQPNGHKPFVAPQQPGQNVYSYFNANMQVQGGMSLRPDRIAGTVEVEIARQVEVIKLSREPQEKADVVVPGMGFRLHTFDISNNGTLQVAFNYHIDKDLDGSPAFLRFEILDPAGNDILRVEGVNETLTRTSIVGAYSNSVALGNREIGSIRVHVVSEAETVEFNFDQRGLSELGL